MKYILTACLAASIAIAFNSCGSSALLTKVAYLNNDVVILPNEKVNDVTLISVSFSSDKAMYEVISQQIQSTLAKKSVTSDMRFYDAKENPSQLERKIKETTKPYYLLIDKVVSGTQKDEMNNDFIFNQINCSLQKNNGEHIADFTISIADDKGAKKTGKTIAEVIIDYLSKKHFI